MRLDSALKISRPQYISAQKISTLFDALDERENVVYDPSTHPSIVEIKNHVDIDNNFNFQNITAERVEKIINTINIKKATGADNILVRDSSVV